MYAAPCEWNKLSEILIFQEGCCYLHTNMDADCKQRFMVHIIVISGLITVNLCNAVCYLVH